MVTNKKETPEYKIYRGKKYELRAVPETKEEAENMLFHIRRYGGQGFKFKTSVGNYAVYYRDPQMEDKKASKKKTAKRKIKGWTQVSSGRSHISWSSGKLPFKIGDEYTMIDFIPPTRREIGYLYIEKHKVKWVDGLASSSTTKQILSTHPKTREKGISIATDYMKKHLNG